LPVQSFSGPPSPLELATIFYCLRFETSLFVTSYDSQGHGGGIRPRLHTGTDFATAATATLCLLGVPNRGHRVEQFSYPLSRKRHSRCAGNVRLRCCEKSVYGTVAQQPTVPGVRPRYGYQQAATYAMDSHVTI
jgi:hypothetical protein